PDDAQDIKENDDQNPHGEATGPARPFHDDPERHPDQAKQDRGDWEGYVLIVIFQEPEVARILSIGLGDLLANFIQRQPSFGFRGQAFGEVQLKIVRGKADRLVLVEVLWIHMDGAVLKRQTKSVVEGIVDD